jgi:hypothetical protein
MSNTQEQQPGKIVKRVLLWSNWLMVLFISKPFIGPPKGNMEFLVKNLAIFTVSVMITAIMLYYLRVGILKAAIGIIWIVIILTAVFLNFPFQLFYLK